MRTRAQNADPRIVDYSPALPDKILTLARVYVYIYNEIKFNDY